MENLNKDALYSASSLSPYYKTEMGECYHGPAEKILASRVGQELKGKVQLILTSPPFPLNRQKQYGNYQGDDYINWLCKFAPIFAGLLTPNGSIVMELGNAWEPGRPVQSLLPLKTLLAFVEHPEGGLRLCQEFICHNPARLPSPAQWVNIKHSRVIDSFTRIWWMSTTDEPKADNRRVLRPYSKSMERLLSTGTHSQPPKKEGGR